MSEMCFTPQHPTCQVLGAKHVSNIESRSRSLNPHVVYDWGFRRKMDSREMAKTAQTRTDLPPRGVARRFECIMASQAHIQHRSPVSKWHHKIVN